MKSRISLSLAVMAFGVASVLPASAHHSFNMFDTRAEAEIVIEGVIKQWSLVNPHSWLTVTATNADGTHTDWSFEAAAIAQLIPKGITIETYKPGEKVTVVAGPLKDGRKAGILKFVRHADGHFTLPNDAGNIGQEALDRWKKRNSQ